MHKQLISFLKCAYDAGLRQRESCGLNVINEKEKQLGVIFPSDFFDYLTSTDGLSSENSNLLWNFWRLSELTLWGPSNSSNRIVSNKDYLVAENKVVCFADRLIEAPIFGINLDSKSGHFGSIIETTYSEQGFDNFFDYLEFFQQESRRMLEDKVF